MQQQPSQPSLAPAAGFESVFRTLPPHVLEAVRAEVQRVELPTGAALFPEGEGIDALYVVLEGLLHATEPAPGGGVSLVRVIGPDGVVDQLQTFSGGARQVEVLAERPSVLAVLSGEAVDRLVERFPELAAARDRLHRRQLLCRLHAILGPLDEAFLDDLETAADWLHPQRGELLFEQDDPADGLFFVIGGRVQVIQKGRDGADRLLAEAGRGDIVGEMEFFTGHRRGARAQAARDSVLVAFTNDEFETLITRHPGLLRHVTRNVVERLARGSARTAGVVTSIALLPIGPGAPARELGDRLQRELERFGPVLRLDAEAVDAHMAEPGTAQALEDTPESERLLAWLESREAAYRFVLYDAEPHTSAWTRRCLRLADRVVLVARADGDPALTELERGLTSVQDRVTDAYTLLALVHADGSCLPTGTRRWLAGRRVHEHQHLRWDGEGDVARLARVLAGRAVGLVLGGGGARGFAHIGVLRALAEAGIPVDVVGGTSMGASMAVQHALGWSPEKMQEINRRVWIELRPHRKLTLPVFSVVGTRKAMECGRMMYGETEIEDLWIPFYCVSSDLTSAEMVVHRSGPVLTAATASASLPGVAVPVLLDGHLLVDGALFNNLPTDIARRMGCGTVIASEVSVEEDATFTCERVPSPWEHVRNRALRRAAPVRFPSLLEVVMRASMLHSIYREKTALLDADLSLRPPIDAFSLMDFDALDQLVEVGYAYTREAVREWQDAGGSERVPVPA
ncbi:MAG TPA: cyclic nucleotide-binding domain-containing protein [Longimicrobiaceae bacterium]|nr:cyclic nucleotide-binding domain-containing protein [Longimicrobiaceae bacterium]